MDESLSTGTKSSLRTSSPSVVLKTTLALSGRHHNNNNNKDLLSAEASGYLFRLADPSMMLVRPDSSPLSPSATTPVAADQDETAGGGGGSNSSTSSRLMASGVSNVSDLLVGGGAGMSPESVTDCGSLSKSSSDGDPVGVVSRKRPPTKLKSRRRNILSFPHHISVDELRLLQVRNQKNCVGRPDGRTVISLTFHFIIIIKLRGRKLRSSAGFLSSNGSCVRPVRLV